VQHYTLLNLLQFSRLTYWHIFNEHSRVNFNVLVIYPGWKFGSVLQVNSKGCEKIRAFIKKRKLKHDREISREIKSLHWSSVSSSLISSLQIQVNIQATIEWTIERPLNVFLKRWESRQIPTLTRRNIRDNKTCWTRLKFNVSSSPTPRRLRWITWSNYATKASHRVQR